MFSLSVRKFPTPGDVPERLLAMSTIMCGLKRRVSYSMDSTCKNRPEYSRGEQQYSPCKTQQNYSSLCCKNHVTTVCQVWRAQGCWMLGVPQRARRAGQRVAKSSFSPQTLHLQQLKVIIYSQGLRGMQGQMAPTQYSSVYVSQTTSGVWYGWT